MYFLSINSNSQVIKVIENKLIENDTSYYDLVKVKENVFWLIGKNGFFKAITSDGVVIDSKSNHTKNALLSVAFFNPNEGIIAGDKGTIIFFNISKKSFELKTLTKYKNRCFYSTCVINDSTALISGGNHLVAKGIKSIPFGIILKTTNRGKTWEKVHSTIFRMIWDILYVKGTNSIMASSYSLNGTVVIQSKDEGKSWETAATAPALIHDLSENNNEVWASGSSGFNHMNDKSKIYSVSNAKTPVFAEDTLGLVWNVAQNSKYTIACLSQGKLIYKKNEDTNWKLLDLCVNKSLYKAVFIDDHSAFILGSRQVLAKIEFEPSEISQEVTKSITLE
ncbi:MAG: hypothetical protein SFY32_15745 [Bacteroidota bacterium]|nr:hypothetical protein [Bacteroidota bacterium]